MRCGLQDWVCATVIRPVNALRGWRHCQMLVERHGGEVPCSFAELESLPGVGHKTASVVLSVAFRMPTFPVDTHIHRQAPMRGFSWAWVPAYIESGNPTWQHTFFTAEWTQHRCAVGVELDSPWSASQNVTWSPT